VATNVHSGTNALLVTVSNAGTVSNSVQIVAVRSRPAVLTLMF